MDNSFFYELSNKQRMKLRLCCDHWIYINKYLKYLRKEEQYYQKTGLIPKILAVFYARKKNKLGLKLGYMICPNTLGENVTIWHHGSIIINGDATLGNGCILHGNNCIGNNGKTKDAPIIGNNVDIGFGASIIGGVRIADNTKIAAGAVVIKSCEKQGLTLAGVPAAIKEEKNENTMY